MEQYYSRQQVADKLGVHINTIRNLMKRGEITGIRVGNNWRIAESEIARYIESAKTPYTDTDEPENAE